MRFSFWLFLPAACLCISAAVHAAAPAWKPEQNVEIIVGPAGGGSDANARLIQKLAREKRLVETPMIVVNKAGGQGAIGFTYLSQQAGSGHHLMITSPTLLTNYITGRQAINYTDVTPLAMIGAEYVVFAVPADSPLKSGKDLAARIKADSSTLSFALANALGNHNHIAITQVASAFGGDIRKLKVVIFNSSGEAVTALLGGHVDVVATPVATALPHHQAGRIRILAVSAEHRLAGALPAVPTWTELGVKSVAANWRYVIGPKGMTAGQIQYWDGVFGRLTREDEWKRDADANLVENTFMGSADTRRLMDTQYAEFSRVLRALDLAKLP